jgi:hypothetical protein
MPNSVISSNANFLLSEWKVLREIIDEVTRPLQVKHHGEAENQPSPFTLLSDDAWEEVHMGPYHDFLRAHIKAHATISRVQFLVNTQKSDWGATLKTQAPNFPTLPAAEVDKFQSAQAKQKIAALSDLTKQHYQAWKNLRTTWHTQLQNALSQAIGEVSETDAQELAQHEPLFDIKKQYIDFNLEWPLKSGEAIDWATYYELRCMVTARNMWLRQQKSADAQAVIKALKPLKSIFNGFNEAAKKLMQAQEQALNKAMVSGA